MKRKLYCMLTLLILVVAGLIGINSNFSNSYGNLGLLLENVEALALPDQGGSSDSWDCYSQQDRSALGYWRCGSPCTWVDGYGGTGTTGKCYKQN